MKNKFIVRVFRLMKPLLTFLILIALSITTHAQVLDICKIDTLPEGIYSTYISYVQGVPMNNMALKKEYINRRAKKDKWMNGCFFHYKVNDQRIKAPFMIKKDKEVYIHTAFVYSKQRKGKMKKVDIGPAQSYIKILEKGRFWFLEGRTVDKIDLASSYGIVGSLIVTPEDKDYRDPIGIIYDTKMGAFDLINTCKDLEYFTTIHRTDITTDCDEKLVTPEEVYKYVLRANEKHNSN